MFGRKHEEMMFHSNFDVFEESTSDEHFHLQRWSFMPFGLLVWDVGLHLRWWALFFQMC